MATIMSIDARPLLTLIGLGLASCATHSTDSDVGTVRTLVRERAELDLAVQRTESPEEADPDVSALASESLTLENAVRIALLNNRELRADLLGLGVARGELVQASVFPSLDFEVAVRFSQDETQDPQWDVGIGVDLTSILLRRGRRGIAEAELDASRFRAAGATLDLAFEVRLAYYDVQAAQQHLELFHTVLDAFVASYEAARTLHEAGNLTDLDLFTEQAAYEGARIAVTEAESDLVVARERLNVLLGLFGRNTTWEIAHRLPDPAPDLGDLDQLESRAIEASIELAEARSTLTAAARRAGLAQTEGLMPNLNIGVHAEHDGTFWEVGPALTGQLPLSNSQRGAVISRRAELEALRERYVADAITIRSTTRVARARATSAEARARHYRETILPLRERVVAQTLLQYNAMQVGVFQLLQARRDQIEAGRAYVSTLLEYWRARATLEQLLAGRLAGTISTSIESAPRAARSGSSERGH